MGGVLSFLSGPFKGLLDGVSGILGKVVTTDKDRLELQAKLDELANNFTLQMAQLDGQLAVEQAKVIMAETNSQSWLARNWRPLFMLVLIYIVFHNYVLAPIFSLHAVEIVPDMWALMKMAMTGYIGGRTAEKIVPQIVTALKK